jgi:serralysin
MTRLRAARAFDMRAVIPSSAAISVVGDTIEVVGGTRGTTVSGDLTATATGVVGTVLGFSQVLGEDVVFTATGVERSASTVLDILEARDNDRFLAYTLSGADVITGSAAADYMIGFGGNDAITGFGGNDDLFGGAGRDSLAGGAGADFLAGGRDLDLMTGGSGNDTFLVADTGDRVVEAAGGGADTILSYAACTIAAKVERLVLIGSAAIRGTGGTGADSLDGNAAANVLAGGAGADRLDGNGGADRLLSGGGRDSLTGGAGADTFQFRSAAEAHGDHVVDFRHGTDRIDLAAIDANAALRDNQTFHFLGEAGFTKHAGELSAAGSYLRGDLNGDGVADFVIALDGNPVLTAGDLLL